MQKGETPEEEGRMTTEPTTEELFEAVRALLQGFQAYGDGDEFYDCSDALTALTLLEQRLVEMEEDAERSGFRVARKFMKDGGSPEWAPEGTIDALRAQRDEVVAALAVHDGHTDGLVADMRRLEAQRDETVSLLEQERRNALLILWAVVMAAGGEVRVPKALLVESDGDLHRFPHPALDGEVFRATRLATSPQEGTDDRAGRG